MQQPSDLAKHARGTVYAAAFAIAAATWLAFADGAMFTDEAASAYGYLAFICVSLALAVSPLRALFPSFKYNVALYMARRALGVSGFVFAFLHYAAQPIMYYDWDFAFFLSASGEYGFWVGVGAAALGALFLLAATSFDYAVARMGRRWLLLHRLVYLAYPAIILHAYFLGSSFSGGKIGAYSGTFLLVAAATLILEAARAVKALLKGKPAAQAGGGTH